MEKNTKNNVMLVILAILAVILTVLIKLQKQPVVQEAPAPAPAPAPAQSSAATWVESCSRQAANRNNQALSLFTTSINLILAEHRKQGEASIDDCVKKVASYTSCCQLVYNLALDKIDKKNRTESYLHNQVHPYHQTYILGISQEVNLALLQLDHDLRRSSVQLITDLATPAPDNQARLQVQVPPSPSRNDYQKALRSLGLNASTTGIAVAFDTVALGKTTLARSFGKKIAALGGRIFAKQAAKLAASGTAVAADGPLIVGDILAVGGIAWTACDVHWGRQEFARDMRASMGNMLDETASDLRRQVLAQAAEMVRHYQAEQDAITQEGLAQFTQGGI